MSRTMSLTDDQLRQIATRDDLVDARPGAYYVTVVDGRRASFLYGPLPSHQEALDMVARVRKIAYEVDPYSWFYAFGTARADDGYSEPGLLNERVDQAEEANE